MDAMNKGGLFSVSASSFWGHTMTVLGNLSRILNRISGGPQGQTLCARIAERRPDCWFCRLMSCIVEPNHCAIELAYWVKHRDDWGGMAD